MTSMLTMTGSSLMLGEEFASVHSVVKTYSVTVRLIY